MSPEMLSENTASPASDLWALGVMIYQMRVGQVPFFGNVDFEVFEKIRMRTLLLPKELGNKEPETVDIINHLLNLEPTERLGAGPPGSDNDFRALKSHPFFANIKWNSINT